MCTVSNNAGRGDVVRKGFKPVALACCIAGSGAAGASELATQGYLGFSLVDTDAAFSCETRACQGVFDDALFYGLSVGFQEEAFGGQIILSQNAEEDPRISLAQLSYTTAWDSSSFSVRGGRIIVPLGLYGTHRISPNTRAGLVMPQSYVLNSFYDILTLSDNGIALEMLNSGSLNLKAAAYQPSDETVETLVVTPGTPLPTNTGLVAGLVNLLLGGGSNTPALTPGSVQLQRNTRTDRGYYLGGNFDQENWRLDGGATQLEFGNDKLRAYNIGFEYTLGEWQPSIELLRLESGKTDPLDGASINLVYSAEHWQLFGNVVRFDSTQTDIAEDVLGGAYYWRDISVRLAHHRIQGGSFESTSSSGVNQNQVNSTILAVAYSFNF